jgi:polysaccharide pyruvyl transferase WcaK-like protein
LRAAPARTVVVSGDIGGRSRYHVGDEAMFTANIDWLRGVFPTARLVAVSADPRFTSRTHGIESLPEPRPGAGLPAAVRSAIARARLLFMSGAGHLASRYPAEIAIRSALAHAALAGGVPVVLTGQTLGPDLDRVDRRLVSSWLRHVSYLGLRDSQVSLRLARALGVPPQRIDVAPDDAWLLAARVRAPVPVVLDRESTPVVGVSLHDESRGSAAWGVTPLSLVEPLAAGLDALVRESGARVLFLSHSTARPSGRGDESLVPMLRARMTHGDALVGVDRFMTDRAVKGLTGACDFVVATRYHALVFAFAAGVPALGLFQDRYTQTKLAGAVASMGLAGHVAPVAQAPAAILRAWHRRHRTQYDIACGAGVAIRDLARARARLAATIAPMLASRGSS